MRDDYDFSKAQANPYAKRLRRPITIRLDTDTVAWFKLRAAETGIPYQTLINLYLRDCVARNREVAIDWGNDVDAA